MIITPTPAVDGARCHRTINATAMQYLVQYIAGALGLWPPRRTPMTTNGGRHPPGTDLSVPPIEVRARGRSAR